MKTKSEGLISFDTPAFAGMSRKLSVLGLALLLGLCTGNAALAETSASVGVSNASVAEGNSGTTPLNFTLTRTGDTSKDIRVTLQTDDAATNPATAGVDYAARPAGTQAVIPAYQTTVTVPVNIIGDTTMEADETFFLHLTAANTPAFERAERYFAPGALSIASADLNGDKKPDLATVGPAGQITVLLNNGNGTFNRNNFNAEGLQPVSVAIADVNLDQYPELIIANQASNTVSVLFATDTNYNTFSGAHVNNYMVGELPLYVTAGNLNTDGFPDIVTANHNGTNVSVLFGSASGRFSDAVAFPTGANPRAVAIRDIDCDGKPDLVVANGGANNVSVLVGDGMGGFSAPVNSDKDTGDLPIHLAVGDLNNDGKLDVAVANFSSNSVTVLQGNCSSTLTVGESYQAGSGPQSVAIADLNGDGKPDLAVANGNEDTRVSVLLGNGDFSFGAPAQYETAPAARSVVIADFDGNGKADIATANSFNSHVSVLLAAEVVPIQITTNEGVGTILNDDDSTSLDTTPVAFKFTDRANVPLNAPMTSNAVTINGVGEPAPVSVSGDASSQYSIGCTGTFTRTASIINNGQRVCVRHTSSTSPATKVNTVLTVGGASGTVSDTFSSTTVAAAADTTPAAFKFTDKINVGLDAIIVSNALTISGINTGTPISVSGDSQYSIGCNVNFTSTNGTIYPGQKVCVRHTSAGSAGQKVDTTLTIGGVADIFSSTTVALADTAPTQFKFTDKTGVKLGVPVTSNTITIAGINTAASIEILSGDASSEYSIGCAGNFTNVAGSILPGKKFCVRHTSSLTPGANQTHTTLRIGGVVQDTFTSSTATAAVDASPTAFTFAAKAGVGYGVLVTSAAITPAGFNTPVNVSIGGAAGSAYSINCNGSFTDDPGVLVPGEKICVRHTSANVVGTATVTTTTLTLGGISGSFKSTTTKLAADSSPNAFKFADRTNVVQDLALISNAITPSGYNTPLNVTVSGGAYSIGCTTAFVTSAGTLSPGQKICVRHTSAATPGTWRDTTLTIGGIADTFSSLTTSKPANTGP